MAMPDSGTGMTSAARARSSAYFNAPLHEFLALGNDAILGQLTAGSDFDVVLAQRDAWSAEIEILKQSMRGLDGHVYLEFDVPRLGSRIDAVLVAGPAIFPLEFKVGRSTYDRADYEQAWDYALDLKNFHRASHEAPIFPILIATAAPSSDAEWAASHDDGVRPPIRCNSAGLAECLRKGLATADGRCLDAAGWGRAPYQPTPTIIEAARALYARHSVEAISRNDAGARNLGITSRCIEQVIDEARRSGQKAIVFVTGVPGAGKTLAGLGVATRRRDKTSETHAVFLSGNGPLVAVLREALIRDELSRRQRNGERVRKGDVRQEVNPFIQNVHHFRDDGLRDETSPPSDHVVIFDEAQRAWNRQQTSHFLQRRNKHLGITQSEPALLIGYMNRHPGWAAVICLVGGGQEINTGEAGIATWLDAIGEHFQHWRVYISPHLNDAEYSATKAIEVLSTQATVRTDPALHLSVSLRSFRAENVSRFVKAALDGDVDEARALFKEIASRYPVALTRDLQRARQWIRARARGTERYGLVASSQADRLKPHAIDVRVEVDPVPWFLNDAADTRSSWYLEDAATEFQIQGLELDWTCVTWDADLRRTRSGWSHHRFRTKQWVRVQQPDRRQYLVNAYRVLLTRARQGMVIFVPPGDPGDPTRQPEFYDETFEYLSRLGITAVEGSTLTALG